MCEVMDILYTLDMNSQADRVPARDQTFAGGLSGRDSLGLGEELASGL